MAVRKLVLCWRVDVTTLKGKAAWIDSLIAGHGKSGDTSYHPAEAEDEGVPDEDLPKEEILEDDFPDNEEEMP